MRTLPVSSLAFVVYVTPVVALGLGAWFEDEPLTLEVVLGTAFVLAAILLAGRSAQRPGRRTATAPVTPRARETAAE